MKRKVIKINEDLCNGCGNCVVGCEEGALKIVDGKAKLVREDFCDGFGNCIGTCPTGALTIEEREAQAFDEKAVKDDSEKVEDLACGCPGTMSRSLDKKNDSAPVSSSAVSYVNPSELSQWPVQLHLVPTTAPYFKDREMVVLSTCSPIASADVHWRFIRGRSVVVACPKLDNTGPYVEKLAEIIRTNNIPKVTCVIMEVPCCRGLGEMVSDAIEQSGKEDQCGEICVVGVDGSIKEIKNMRGNK